MHCSIERMKRTYINETFHITGHVLGNAFSAFKIFSGCVGKEEKSYLLYILLTISLNMSFRAASQKADSLKEMIQKCLRDPMHVVLQT